MGATPSHFRARADRRRARLPLDSRIPVRGGVVSVRGFATWAWRCLGALALTIGGVFAFAISPARGLLATLLTLTVGAGLIAAACAVCTRSSRVPLDRTRSLPRRSAHVLVVLALGVAFARERGLVAVDYWRMDTLAYGEKSFFGGLPAIREVRLDANEPLRRGFYRTCQCTERRSGPADTVVKKHAWYACLLPLYKPIDTTIAGANFDAAGPWRLAVRRLGSGRGFAGWAACEQKIGEDLGTDFAEGRAGL
jgi:hypothetical protein